MLAPDSNHKTPRVEESQVKVFDSKRTLSFITISPVPLASSKDFDLGHVLIIETKDRKTIKFMCPEVPYLFTSQEQYEMAMRNSLGSE